MLTSSPIALNSPYLSFKNKTHNPLSLQRSGLVTPLGQYVSLLRMLIRDLTKLKQNRSDGHLIRSIGEALLRMRATFPNENISPEKLKQDLEEYPDIQTLEKQFRDLHKTVWQDRTLKALEHQLTYG